MADSSDTPSATHMSSQSDIARAFDKSLDSLVTQLKLDRHDRSNEGDDYDGNTFHNATYHSNVDTHCPVFADCHLENVHFIQCKFRDTQFRNLNLVNVAFLYVDFENVTMSDVSLENHLWKTTIIRNAFLSGAETHCASSPWETTLEPVNPISSGSVKDHTVIETLRLESPAPAVAKSIQCFEKNYQAALRATPRPLQGLLTRLVDHEHIISRVVHYLVGKNDYFFERPKHPRIVALRQDSRSILNEGGDREMQVYCPESTPNTCLASLMLRHVSLARSMMMSDHLHGPFDRIVCRTSEPICLPAGPLTPLVLYYEFEGGSGFIKTDDEAWHQLMVHIRHDASCIPAIHLKIGRHFWDIARWRDGVVTVMNQTSLRNSPNRFNSPNFLEKVAKIAAPADRWKTFRFKDEEGGDYDKFGDFNWCSHGTSLQITIDGTDSAEKEQFVQKLARCIEKLRRARPLFHWDNGMTYVRRSAELIRYWK